MLALSTIIAFLGSPGGRVAGLVGGSALALMIAGGVGFHKGDAYRTGIDAAAQAAFVQKQITARDAADKAAATIAAQDAVIANKSQDRANDAIKSTSSATCLDGNDANQLRALWGKSDRSKPPRPAK